MIDYTRYDKYRGLWAAQATDTETCPGTVGEHYRSSDEALADLIEAADGHDISTLWCDGAVRTITTARIRRAEPACCAGCVASTTVDTT